VIHGIAGPVSEQIAAHSERPITEASHISRTRDTSGWYCPASQPTPSTTICPLHRYG